MPRHNRPSREQGRLVCGLLQTGRTNPDGWLRDEREAVTALHTWAHGAPPKLAARPTEPATPTCDDPTHDHTTSACLGPRIAPAQAGDVHDDLWWLRPSPLPSELLRSVDAGRGVAGWVLTPEVLDRLPQLMRDEVPDGGLLPELGVDDSPHVDALRAEVARLSAGWADTARERDEHRARADHAERSCADAARDLDEARAWGADLGRQLDEIRAAGISDDLVRDVRERGVLIVPPGIAGSWGHHPPRELRVEGPGTVTCSGRWLRVTYDEPINGTEGVATNVDRPDLDEPAEAPGEPEPATPLDGDPRRPHLDHYDEAGVTLSWRELRNLVALHLDHAETSPARPATLARAMREDGAPLRLAEVLDR